MDSTAFLRQVGAIALLSPSEEVDLALRLRAGTKAAERLAAGPVPDPERTTLQRQVAEGDAARERMVQANLRLVVSVARRYTRSGLPLLDLVQEGTVGLIQAVDRFDPDQGCKFSTYATWWIRQAVTRGMVGSGRTVRLPRQVLQRLNACLGLRQQLVAQLGREPSLEELAAACAYTVEETAALLRAETQPMSLDLSGSQESEDVTDRHAVDPVEAAATSVGADRVRVALRGLEPLEREVLSLRYGFTGEPLGCTAVATALGLTRDRVRTIEQRALRALGASPGMAELADDLGAVDAAS